MLECVPTKLGKPTTNTLNQGPFFNLKMSYVPIGKEALSLVRSQRSQQSSKTPNSIRQGYEGHIEIIEISSNQERHDLETLVLAYVVLCNTIFQILLISVLGNKFRRVLNFSTLNLQLYVKWSLKDVIFAT